MTNVYVICPAGLVSGGSELLHQLVRALNEGGQAAFIVYHPFSPEHQVPGAFAQYNIAVAQRSDVLPGSQVVLPEVASRLIDEFPACRINFWWLSVDNFFVSLERPGLKRLAYRFLERRALRRAGSVSRHLYQSEYARQFLDEKGFGPSAHLGDYINVDYLDLISNMPSSPREDIVAYNPAKGREQTALVLDALAAQVGDAIRAVPIVNLDRSQVRDLLSSAKLYIDFGNHPGKDRIPREAAAAGACVLVNRRGSAANEIDVPLPDYYKVDDTYAGFAQEASSRIIQIVEGFAAHQPQFDTYRGAIAAERDDFFREAADLFGPKASIMAPLVDGDM